MRSSLDPIRRQARATGLCAEAYYCGKARQAKGDLNGAIVDYSDAIRLDPKYGLAYSCRAEAYKAKWAFLRAYADNAMVERLRGGS
jgi:tetratricopeptide (TPR) repeat protein